MRAVTVGLVLRLATGAPVDSLALGKLNLIGTILGWRRVHVDIKLRLAGDKVTFFGCREPLASELSNH